jgi:hypothetical protein
MKGVAPRGRVVASSGGQGDVGRRFGIQHDSKGVRREEWRWDDGGVGENAPKPSVRLRTKRKEGIIWHRRLASRTCKSNSQSAPHSLSL